MSMEKPKYLEWVRPGKQTDINEEYADYLTKPIPKSDASEKEIKEFIADALEAEEAIKHDLMQKGYSDRDAEIDATMWPLKEKAPMNAARDFLQYHENLIEAMKNGIDF